MGITKPSSRVSNRRVWRLQVTIRAHRRATATRTVTKGPRTKGMKGSCPNWTGEKGMQPSHLLLCSALLLLCTPLSSPQPSHAPYTFYALHWSNPKIHKFPLDLPHQGSPAQTAVLKHQEFWNSVQETKANGLRCLTTETSLSDRWSAQPHVGAV